MRKLNKKGFTLIELLAVIVVLAIVLVVTIPSVLSSMSDAKTKQFNNAIATIEEYTRKQKEACDVGDYDLAQFTSSLFTTGTCNFKTDTTTVNSIVTAAGYTIGIYSTTTDSCSEGTDNSKNNKNDFCAMSISTAGAVSNAKSPDGSKFGWQSQ